MNWDIDDTVATPEDLQSALIAYIKHNLTDLVGEHATLLDREGGLDAVAELAGQARPGKR